MADYVQDFSNNLATDLAPLLALFGEPMARQFLSESTHILDYIIFAMAPIGIITAVVSAIRVCGGAYMRAFIGRAQEGLAMPEVELCTSTGRDVCEMFTKGGITRALGRPSVLELVLIPPPERTSGSATPETTQVSEPQLWIYRKYLRDKPRPEVPPEAPTTTPPASDTSTEANLEKGGCLSRLRNQGTHEPKGPPVPDTDLPNLSINVGIVKWPPIVSRAIAVIGITLQSGVLVLAGLFSNSALLGVSDEEGEPRLYAPVMFIAGTVVMCSGMCGCAALVGETTHEEGDKGRSPDKRELVWLQPGNQKVGDQLFGCFAIFETAESPVERYMMSTRDERKQDMMKARTIVATSATLIGFIAQFIGLRGLNAWVSIAQLIATVIMSLLRGVLRMKRRSWEHNQLREYDHRAHGYELDWLAISLACTKCTSIRHDKKGEENRDHARQSQSECCRFEVEATRGSEQNGETGLPGTACCLANVELIKLFNLRRKLAILTGNIPGTVDVAEEKLKGQYQTWNQELVTCRRKSFHIAKAICDLAAIFKSKPAPLQVNIGIRGTNGDRRQQTVELAFEGPSESATGDWSIDTAAIEALLGLWLWSVIESSSRSQDTDMLKIPTVSARIVSIGDRDNDKTWDRHTSVDKELKLLLGPDTPKLHDGKLSNERNLLLGLVSSWEAGDGDETCFIQQEDKATAMHLFFGWQGIHTPTAPLKMPVKYIKTGGSMLDILGQEIYMALVTAIATKDEFRYVTLSLEGNPTNCQLTSKGLEEATQSFVDQGLGKRSDAVLCLLSAFGKKVRVRLDEEKVAELVAYFLATDDYRAAEPELRWLLLSALDNKEYHALETERHALKTKRLALQKTKQLALKTKRLALQKTKRRVLGAKRHTSRTKRLVLEAKQHASRTKRLALEIKQLLLETKPLVLEAKRHKRNLERLVRSAFDFYRRSIQVVGLEHKSFFLGGMEFLKEVIPAPGVGVLDLKLCAALLAWVKRPEDGIRSPPEHDFVGTLPLINENEPADPVPDDLVTRTFWASCGKIRITEGNKQAAEEKIGSALLHASNQSKDNPRGPWAIVLLSLVQAASSSGASPTLITKRLYDKSLLLLHAVKMKDEDLARLIHSHGAETGWNKENDKETPLLEAKRTGNRALVRLFVPFGTNDYKEGLASRLLNKQCLFEAVKDGEDQDLAPLETALGEAKRERWDLDVWDGEGRTLISYAAEKAHVEMVKLLLEKGASAKSQDRRQKTPLIWAASTKDGSKGRRLQVIRELQYDLAKRAIEESNDVTVEMRKILDREPGVQLIRRYLFYDRDAGRDADRDADMDTDKNADKGAEKGIEHPDQWENWDNPSPDSRPGDVPNEEERERILGIVDGRLSRVLSIIDGDKDSALGLAAQNGYLSLVKQLYSTVIDDANIDGLTAIPIAADMGCTAVVKELMTTGPSPRPSVNSRSRSGKTPLMYAARGLHKDVVAQLITADDLEVNAESREKWTAICYAVANNEASLATDDKLNRQKGIITLLDDKGATIPCQKKKNGGGKSLSEFASKDTIAQLSNVDGSCWATGGCAECAVRPEDV